MRMICSSFKAAPHVQIGRILSRDDEDDASRLSVNHFELMYTRLIFHRGKIFQVLDLKLR
jgi:hypothetical protein